MQNDLVAYYKERAREYENIYLKRERQDDLRGATLILQELFEDKTIIEIACGTGYWTEKIAQRAKHIFASDINEAVLEVARQKGIPAEKVSFSVGDIYSLAPGSECDGLFGGFIWSHISLQRLDAFIDTVNKAVGPGGRIVFMDNNYVAGSSTPIGRTDEDGNTFQTRQLSDGSQHEVLKNFPSETFLRQKHEGLAEDIEVIEMEYYWILSYRNL